MPASGPIVPILPAVDMERAKGFYQEKLGLKLVSDSEGGCILECGDGSRLFIYPHEATKADHTVAGFSVDDVETEV